MSAAILFLIVGMWAALIVPMIVRRHDETLEARSVDRFSTAMRVLSRRPTGRYVVVPRRPHGAAEPVLSPPVLAHTLRVRSGAAGRAAVGAAAGAADGAAAAGRAGLRGVDGARAVLRDRVHAWQDERDARLAARGPLTCVQRRRRTFTVLATTALVTLGLALSPAGDRAVWSVHVLADLVLLGCVVVLRVQVVRAAQAAWLAETQGDGWGEDEHWTGGWAEADGWDAPVTAGSPPADAWALPTQEGEAAVDQGVTAEVALVPAVGGPLAPGSPWQPVPVPVPTYVTAPQAPRRVIDLDAPAPSALVDEDVDLLDDILEDRRAVGS